VELSFTRKGHAFGVPADSEEQDLFIPDYETPGYFNGDVVEAKVVGQRGQRKVGSIVRLVRRSKQLMLGTIMREKRKVSFYPVDEPGVYRVENFKEFRRFVPTKSYFVVRLPRAGEDTVYIVDAFAGSQTNELDFYRVVCESGISVDFPPAVNSSLEALPDSVPEEAKEQRVDLRDLDTFTVDGKDARDLDDAASIRFSGGRITLWIHIADVSAYVEPDTELDREAARRTTSVYLGNRVIPMLPPKLSNGVCSLHQIGRASCRERV